MSLCGLVGAGECVQYRSAKAFLRGPAAYQPEKENRENIDKSQIKRDDAGMHEMLLPTLYCGIILKTFVGQVMAAY